MTQTILTGCFCSNLRLSQLINRQVLYQTASDLGIRVATDEVSKQLLTSPVYQIDGKFNEAVYRQQLQVLGYQPVEFLQEYSSALSAEQLRSGVADGVLVTDWEIAEAVRILEQRRDLRLPCFRYRRLCCRCRSR